MKRIAFRLFTALCLLAALTSCNESTEEYVYIHEPAPEPAHPLLGTYTFGAEEYPIYHASCAVDDTYCTFRFSPVKEDPMTTSILFQLVKVYLGETQSIENLYHNDDYRLVYEDPAHYYSYYRALQGGIVLVEPHPTKGENYFVVRLDVRLADGTPLKLEYEGDLPLMTAK
ncbi:hypothetical protein [uncultured Alistipes sp.]|uniref:hypothetical protein n=1 Tax=uncultured Alistipes sp. TaxID=538949 RepID=UPI00260F385A|nr:hypothetical protein [uncultured Alistipes sp.]